jgi:GNAT superfamily N-acetyltransferase
MIRRCTEKDYEEVCAIVNDAAHAYKGNIPSDRWHEPYMPKEELKREIGAGVVFFGYEEDGRLLGVMGLQNVKDVTLIRHAYVRTEYKNKGIGGRLLKRLLTLTQRPTLVGTWAGAWWAVKFYEKYGYKVVILKEKDRLLKKYWNITERQIETSIVLADAKWRKMI